MRPLRLADLALFRKEFGRDRFDIQHQRAIKRVQAGDYEFQPIHSMHPANGRADTVWTCFAPLREDSRHRHAGFPRGCREPVTIADSSTLLK